VHKGQSSS